MGEDLAYLVAKALTSIFKKRPYIAFFIFLFITAAVLSVWALLAKTADERIFPIIALAFVLIIFIWYSILIYRRWSIIKTQTYDEPAQMPVREPEMIKAVPAPAPPQVYPRTDAAQGKPSVQASHLLLGAIAAVVIAAPLVLIASLLIIFSPIIEEEAVEGITILVGLLLCILVPVAAGLGALFGTLAARRARVRTTGRLNWLAALAGGITGLILGVISMLIVYFLAATPSLAPTP